MVLHLGQKQCVIYCPVPHPTIPYYRDIHQISQTSFVVMKFLSKVAQRSEQPHVVCLGWLVACGMTQCKLLIVRNALQYEQKTIFSPSFAVVITLVYIDKFLFYLRH